MLTPEDLASIRAIVREEVARMRRAPLSKEDYETLGPLFEAIAQRIGPEPFAMAELLEMFPRLLSKRSQQSLSKLFEKAAGRDVGGLTAERVGFDNGRLTWKLVPAYTPLNPER